MSLCAVIFLLAQTQGVHMPRVVAAFPAEALDLGPVIVADAADENPTLLAAADRLHADGFARETRRLTEVYRRPSGEASKYVTAALAAVATAFAKSTIVVGPYGDPARDRPEHTSVYRAYRKVSRPLPPATKLGAKIDPDTARALEGAPDRATQLLVLATLYVEGKVDYPRYDGLRAAVAAAP